MPTRTVQRFKVTWLTSLGAGTEVRSWDIAANRRDEVSDMVFTGLANGFKVSVEKVERVEEIYS